MSDKLNFNPSNMCITNSNYARLGSFGNTSNLGNNLQYTQSNGLTWSNPFTSDNFKALGSHIGSGVGTVAGGLWDGTKSLLGIQSAQTNVNKQTLVDRGLAQWDEKKENLINLSSNVKYNEDTGTYDIDSHWNMGQALGNINNLAKAGLAGWGLYESIDSYNDRKSLLKTQKATAEEQYKQLVEDRAHLQKERARQDKIRNTAVKQRASSSSVTSW